jgi:hypothetical protein
MLRVVRRVATRVSDDMLSSVALVPALLHLVPILRVRLLRERLLRVRLFGVRFLRVRGKRDHESGHDDASAR